MKEEIRGVLGIIEKDGKYLLGLESKQGPMHNRWRLLGGKLEAGENSQEALVRELREEVGIEVAVKDLLGTTNGSYRPIQIDVYSGLWVSGELKPKEDELFEARWCAFLDTFSMDVEDLSRDLLCRHRAQQTLRTTPKRTYFGPYMGCDTGAIE